MSTAFTKKLMVPDRNFIHFIDQFDILFFQSDSCYVTVSLTNGSQFVLIKSLTKLENEVSSDIFIRVSQSFLINKNKIKNIDRKQKKIILNEAISVPFTIKLNKLLELIQ